MISVSLHHNAGDGGGGDFGLVADGGGVGDDKGRRRGVSGISMGMVVG